MGDIERERVALHEAGHVVVAHALGCVVEGLTIEPGSVRAGCSRYIERAVSDVPLPDVGMPLAAWPAEWRSWAETRVIIHLAGGAAERMFGPRRTGRVGSTVADRAMSRVAGLEAGDATADLVPASPTERDVLTAPASDDTLPADADVVAHLVRIVHGDVSARSEAWLRWLGEECHVLLSMRETQVRRLAAAAMEMGTIGAQAAARLLERSRC